MFTRIQKQNGEALRRRIEAERIRKEEEEERKIKEQIAKEKEDGEKFKVGDFSILFFAI